MKQDFIPIQPLKHLNTNTKLFNYQQIYLTIGPMIIRH